MTRRQLATAIGLLLGIAGVHLVIPERELTLHILLRLVYLVPIAMVALRKGKKAGLMMSLAATALFLPHFLFQQATVEFNAGNVVALVMFNLTGFVAGTYRDKSERGYVSSQQRQTIRTLPPGENRILFFVDNSPLSMDVARWFSTAFADRNRPVTLLWTHQENLEDTHATSRAADEEAARLLEEGRQYLEKIKAHLGDAGFPENMLTIKVRAVSENSRTSDAVLEEIQEGGYGMVLLGKHGQTKAQEFLFGDPAVRLLRTSPVPVLAVTGEEQKNGS